MTSHTHTIFLPDTQATEQCGKQLANLSTLPVHYYFSGPLGSGKTTLIRAFLQALGVQGTIKSPSFSIVEPYSTDQGEIYHFDFYHIADPSELEHIGVRDYFANANTCLVEWPEHGGDYLPVPDIGFTFSFANDIHHLHLNAYSEQGKRLITKVKK